MRPTHVRTLGGSAAVLSACALGSVLLARPAQAQQLAPALTFGGQCRPDALGEAIVDAKDGGIVDVSAAPGKLSTIDIPTHIPIRRAEYTENRIEFRQVGNTVEIIPSLGIPFDTVASVRLRSDPGAPPIVARVIVSAVPVRNRQHIIVRTESNADGCLRIARPILEKEFEERAQNREDTASIKATLQTVIRMNRKRYHARLADSLDPDGPLQILTGAGSWAADGYFALPVRITHTGDRPVSIKEARFTASDGASYTLDVELATPTDDPDHLVTIDPDQLVDGALAIRPPKDTRPLAPFKIELIGDDGRRIQGIQVASVDAQDGGIDDKTFILITKQEMEERRLRRQERERQETERRRLEEAKRIQVQVAGSYGAVFISSGADGSEEADAASLMEVGGRVIKGFTPALAFEAEITAGTSGNTSGQASADLGRVVLGGRIRGGESTVWHARMGIGLQAIRASTSTGTETEGSGIIVFGGGVDWRIGNQLTAGVSAGTSLRGVERIQTIEAGFHIGLVLGQ